MRDFSMQKVLVKHNYLKYLFFITISVVVSFVVFYLITELVARLYFSTKIPIIDEYSQDSISAISWFENWELNGLYSMNRGFVEKTCYAIFIGKYTYTWDTKSYCDKLKD